MKKAAYNFLARREHSQQELKQKLKRKEFDDDDIDLVLEKLAEQDIQSDLRYGEALFRQRVQKGYGWQYIRAELKQKGLAAGIIQTVYQSQKQDWFANAAGVYEKRFGEQPAIDDKERAKRTRFMLYRGFEQSHIIELIST
ncbi:regulatory protein RecX [Thalassotalea litorea]|uniref:Regulatory protein RecX n=1 Tax=Thalassotalea litorea TaxID=2020715 RepID=A0A5R9IHA1_9GAMM|nr:regulatory protein RecX [Thalassotalea litorea]